VRLDDRRRGHHQGSEDRWEAMRALSSRPFCSCDGRRVSMGDLSAAYRDTTKRCRIVKDRLRLWKEGVRDLVMELCCALHNFRVRLHPWLPMI